MSIELKQAAQQVLDAFEVFGEADDFATLFTLTQKMHALHTAIQQAESEPVGAREALERIASWSEHPAMLGVDYGSNGVRDYYRKIARDALTHPAPGVPDDVVRDAERYRWLRSLEHCNEAWCFIGSGNANSNLDAAIDAAMRTAAQAQKGQR